MYIHHEEITTLTWLHRVMKKSLLQDCYKKYSSKKNVMLVASFLIGCYNHCQFPHTTNFFPITCWLTNREGGGAQMSSYETQSAHVVPQDSGIHSEETANCPPLYSQAVVILIKRREEMHLSYPESTANYAFLNRWDSNSHSTKESWLSGSLLCYLLLTNKFSVKNIFLYLTLPTGYITLYNS